MKQKALYFVLISLFGIALTGCGGGSSSPATTPAPTGGSVTGYIYEPVQNTLRTAAAGVPAGYVGIEGATVSFQDGSIDPATTDSSGFFRFDDVPGGRYTLTASKSGYADMSFEVDVETGQTTDTNESAGDGQFVLTPAATGTLNISSSTTCPITIAYSADVYFIDDDGGYNLSPYTLTNNSTSIAISDIAAPASYTVTLRADYFSEPAAQTASIAAGSSDSLSFTLNPLGNPFTTIVSPVNGGTYTDEASISFTGTSLDCEDGPLSGGSLVWTSDVDGQLGTGGSVQKTGLTTGDHVITLTATDSGGNTGVATAAITIVENTDPVAYILLPVNNSTYSEGATISFSGTGIDFEENTLTGGALVWTSSIDGQIGTGNTFISTGLSIGAHTVTLTVTDSGGRTDTSKITLNITAGSGSIPTAVLITPLDGALYIEGMAVSFTGTGTDAQDGALSGSSLSWFSSEDGLLGTGSPLEVSSLSAATHTITLTVIDSDGFSDTDTATIGVYPTGQNLPPQANILTPADGTSVEEGSNILFTGTGTDPQDGTLSGTSLVWTSDIYGPLGAGTAVNTSILSQATHTITLTATDSEGATGNDTITVIITEPEPNTAPTAVITTPIDGSSIAEGQTIFFTGAGADAQDGPITGTSLSWSSDVYGGLGTGAFVQHDDLTQGVHVITLTAIDEEGLTGTDTVTITITP